MNPPRVIGVGPFASIVSEALAVVTRGGNRRAVELGLGVGSAGAIELIADSAAGRAVAASVRAELARG